MGLARTSQQRAKGSDSESHYDTAEDDMLDSVLMSAAHSSSNASRPRNRTRARNKERKSCECTQLLSSHISTVHVRIAM